MSLRNRIENFRHLPGSNCVTTAIRNIVNHHGYRYPESMIFGLCEGLGFQFTFIEGLDHPYLSGVGKGLVESFCHNLNLTLDVAEFDDDGAAMEDLREHIDRQIPVIVQVDLYHLPYFESRTHFAGHQVVPVAYDEENVYCADTGFRELRSCPVAKFMEARRTAYPPHSPNRRRTRIDRICQRPFVEETVTKALYNLGQKFEDHLPGYDLRQIHDLRDNLDAYKTPRTLHAQIEKAGIGGSLSRKLFAEFLDQAAQLYARAVYEEASFLYDESATLWHEVAVAARGGSVDGIKEKLDRIYGLETEGVGVFSSFESEEL